MPAPQCLLYNPYTPVNLVTPLINIDQLIKLCNYTIKKTEYDQEPVLNWLAWFVSILYTMIYKKID